ncbi:hypothetical protein HPB51_022453 [Rhipicephalus microplus]|uniref:BLOC-1 subunit 6 n=1 Tax=Rhipicephalus microplus TaxID=6941 RepID=A0A9J6DQX1_RHIMP|nr:hypothetical protein HPB51_022453 [Rhipicephalus microplus]
MTADVGAYKSVLIAAERNECFLVQESVISVQASSERQIAISASHVSKAGRNQGLLLDTVQQENNRFADALGSLDDVLQRARVYQAKLVRIKRDMAELQQRSSRLRKRALRLQQLKQKEALQAEQQRQRDLERTRQLQPRVAPQLAPP